MWWQYWPTTLLLVNSQWPETPCLHVSCSHWTHTSTELPCGERGTNCQSASVPPREFCRLQSRPSADGLWMPLPFILSPLSSPRWWESELIQLGVWRPPRPFLQVSQYRTSAMLLVSPRPWPSSGFVASICGPLQALPFSRPRCAPEGYTQGRDSEVWQHGHLVPQSILTDAARFPEEESLMVTYVTLVPWRNEMLRLSATPSASLAAFCFIPWSWCRLHRTCFYTNWPLHYPAREVSPIIWTDYTQYSEPLMLETFLKASYRMQHLIPSRNQHYIRNLRHFFIIYVMINV